MYKYLFSASIGERKVRILLLPPCVIVTLLFLGTDLEDDLQEQAQPKTGDKEGDDLAAKMEFTSNLEHAQLPEAGILSSEMQTYVDLFFTVLSLYRCGVDLTAILTSSHTKIP